MNEKLAIIIAAAGESSRFGKKNKLIQNFKKIPLFLHSLSNFKELCPDEQIVVVVAKANLELFKKMVCTYLGDYNFTFIVGGKTRAKSVLNGLKALPSTVEWVAIHDAARPMATAELLDNCLNLAKQNHCAIIPGKPVADTLKRTDANGNILNTIDRENAWRVETPQVFELSKLKNAFAASKGNIENYTDEAAIMETSGYPIKIYHNLEPNEKITYSDDLAAVNEMMD